MNCPSCNKLTSDVGKNCVHCGEVLHKIKRISGDSVKCPLCNIKTEIIYLVGMELDYCYQCSGMWFDKGEIKEFQNAITDQKRCSEMATVLKELSIPKRNTERTTYLNCPVCSQSMLHKQFVEVSGIVLDKCSEHGTWAEQEDLEKILDIVSSGDLDTLIAKAARHNQDKIEKRLREIETKQNYLNKEISETRRFSRVHFLLDFLGFT